MPYKIGLTLAALFSLTGCASAKGVNYTAASCDTLRSLTCHSDQASLSMPNLETRRAGVRYGKDGDVTDYITNNDTQYERQRREDQHAIKIAYRANDC